MTDDYLMKNPGSEHNKLLLDIYICKNITEYRIMLVNSPFIPVPCWRFDGTVDPDRLIEGFEGIIHLPAYIDIWKKD